MTLDAGGVEKIESPSAEQVRHFLRFMPPASPFVVLSASDNLFIQAAPVDERYRVEYRDGKQHFFAIVPLERAAALFEAFLANDTSFRTAVRWRRLSALNDPYHPAVLIVTILLVLGLAALYLWARLT